MLFPGRIWRKMARNLYLIRHGQVINQLKGKFVGSTDADLSLSGLEQAARLNIFLSRKTPDICFSSPMRRCLQTAEQAIASLNIELFPKKMFREVDFGEWEGLGFNDIVRSDPVGVEKWIRCDQDFRFPQGESLAEFIERIETSAGFLLKIPQDTVAVFTHGGVIRFMLCQLLGLALRKHSIFEVNYTDVYVLKILNNSAVLSGILNSEDM